ncbi:ligase-associated DNA damage response endonuclease PdeM [Tropicimonas sp. IMCC34043]|uniref:ligase-associated DNA damage response endonuclease PdeM n=1 Tax=Tropicimonas sp. IMCC34043 TaxID=2248760 RepID=UPI000E21E1EA|nr:ligase-associated DNA damage response endonuclease PdeM [Tropicimonas sp. IMCC34043]
MNTHSFRFNGETLHALPSGALYWPAQGLLCVSDLHFGKSGRLARRGAPLLPPFDALDTLARLEAAVQATEPTQVICLGDSFDDLEAAADLAPELRLRLDRAMAGRRWSWIEGNHDPAPTDLPGQHLSELVLGPLSFRHIARPDAAPGEVSGHYHPKAGLGARGGGIRRPCFLTDGIRLILPAFGTYTGGLDCRTPALRALFGPGAVAILTGPTAACIPLRTADAG